MKIVPLWIKILFVLAIVVASKFIFFSKIVEAGGGKNDKSALPIKVNYFVIQSSRLENSIYTAGSIGALKHIEIIPEVSGKITKVYFNEGQFVSKGTLLVELNDNNLQAQLLKIKTQISLSVKKLERLKNLLAINGISQEEFDMQEGELNALKADETFIAAEIEKTKIYAAFDGVLGLKQVSEGSFVNALTPITTLVQLKPLFVEFSVPEKYAGEIRKGSSVTFVNENSRTENTYTASVYAIEPRVDEDTKTIKLRALYSGDKVFYPGNFVKVFIDFGAINNTIMIPSQAVIATLKGQKVFICKNNLAQEVPVNIGVRTDIEIQVLEGLKIGDTVITSGLLSLKKDSKLILIESSK